MLQYHYSSFIGSTLTFFSQRPVLCIGFIMMVHSALYSGINQSPEFIQVYHISVCCYVFAVHITHVYSKFMCVRNPEIQCNLFKLTTCYLDYTGILDYIYFIYYSTSMWQVLGLDGFCCMFIFIHTYMFNSFYERCIKFLDKLASKVPNNHYNFS